MKKTFLAALTATLLSLNCAHLNTTYLKKGEHKQNSRQTYSVIEQKVKNHIIIDEDLGKPFFDMPALDLYVGISQGIVVIYEFKEKRYADIPQDISQRLKEVPDSTLNRLLTNASYIGSSKHISKASLYLKLIDAIYEPFGRPEIK